jgi:hypothetical protein
MHGSTGELLEVGIEKSGSTNHVNSSLELSNVIGKMTADILVVEFPVIYPTDKQKGNPNDLVKLATMAGMVLAQFQGRIWDMFTPTPREWKGGIPKEIHHQRLAAMFPEAEAKMAHVAKSYQHNVWDAIGLADWGRKQIK